MANIPFLNNAYFAAKVGIGTGSPGYNLVVGDGTTDTESRFYHNDASYTSVRGYGLFMSRVNSYIRPTTEGTQTLWIGASNATWNYVSVDTNQFQVQKDGTSRLYINSDGNVGIGTTSPDSQLEVHYAPAGNTGAQIKLGSGDVGYETTITNYRRLTDSTFEIASYDDTILGYNRATSKTWLGIGSNVGIGTTSPSEKLEVAGNIQISAADGYLQFKDTNAASGNSIRRIYNGEQNLYFSRRNDDGTLEANDMVIASSGNVGIGTTNPVEKLQINSGDVLINNSSVSTLKSGGSLYLDLNTFGSLGGRNFRVQNNGTVHLNINASGNVGIGTTSPVSKLEVYGGSSGVNDVDRYVRFKASNGEKRFDFYVGGTGNASSLGMYTSDGTTKNIQISAGGTSYFNAGNVGIGTTSPARLLHVNSSGQTDIHLTSSGQGTTSTDGMTVFLDSSGTGGLWLREAQALRFATSSSEKMRIDSSGNVGIGTTSPARLLSVNGVQGWSASGTEKAAINPTSTGTDFTLIGNNGNIRFDSRPSGNSYVGTGNFGVGTTSPLAKLHVKDGNTLSSALTNTSALIEGFSQSILQIASHSSGYSQIAFGDQDDGFDGGFIYSNASRYLSIETANAERMRIDSAGNVGIGTNSPTAKLDVNGEIKGTSFSGPGQGLSNLLSLGAYQGAPAVGILIATNIVTNNYSFIFGTIKIEQFNFTSKQTIEFSATTNNNGTLITKDATSDVAITFKLFNYSGKWYLWFPMPSTYSTCTAFINTGAGYQGQSKGFNEVSTVTVSAVPSSGVTNSYDITPKVYLTTSTPSGNLPGGPYLPLAGGTMTGVAGVVFPDAFKLNLGTGSDLEIFHDAADSIINNNVGHLYISQKADDKDIIFRSDDGSGGIVEYFKLDGTNVRTLVSKPINLIDSVPLQFGNSQDLRIYHNGSNSYIQDAGVGSLKILAQNFDLTNAAESALMIRAIDGAQVELYYGGAKKFETTSTGVTVTGAATATTFLGDLNGTINTATTAVTKANATNDTTVATTAFVQNLIGTIPAGLVFQGTWNAATNTPTLTSGSGTTGHFYIVSTDGSTNLDGITDWKVGDWAVFVEQGASDQWEKVDNSSVLDGSGTGQSVTKWDGSGTSNTLTNGPITFSGNNSTFAGDISTSGNIYLNNNKTIFGKNTSGSNYGLLTITSGNIIKLGAYAYTSAATQIGLGDNGAFLIGTDTALSIDNSKNATFAGDLTISKSTPKLIFDNLSGGGLDPSLTASGTNFTLSTSSITPLSIALDTGDATFAGSVTVGTKLMITSSSDYIDVISDDLYIVAADKNILYSGNAETLRLDESQNATFAGDVYIPEYIYHSGDTNTYIRFTADTQTFRTGGDDRLILTNTTATFAGTVNVDSDLKVRGSSGEDHFVIAPQAAGTGTYLISYNNAETGYEPLRIDAESYNFTNAGTSIISTSGLNTTFAGDVLVEDNLYLTDDGTVRGKIQLNASDRDDLDIKAVSLGSNMKFFTVDAERMRITSTGNVGIGTTAPSYKLSVPGGVEAGGKVTYTKSYGNLNTTGNAVAGLTTSSNGQSAGFTFTCFGHSGGYQKIVYSCYNGGGNWYASKVIDEGTNQLDVVASANSTTITFTFKSISGTMSYTPRVTVEAVGTAINSTYA